jgi:hypothetical protein
MVSSLAFIEHRQLPRNHLAVPAGQFLSNGQKKGGDLVELEQRVKALEFELKILKNEIQRTLLEVQEQILIHYYPELRSEESLSEGVLQSFEAIQDKKAQLGKTSPPEVRQVSLDEARAMRQKSVAAPPGEPFLPE